MDSSAVWKTFPPYEFRVERGKIAEFADAIGDTAGGDAALTLADELGPSGVDHQRYQLFLTVVIATRHARTLPVFTTSQRLVAIGCSPLQQACGRDVPMPRLAVPS